MISNPYLIKRHVFLLSFSLLLSLMGYSCAGDSPTETKKTPLWGDAPFEKPSCVKGIHLTSWYAGSKKGRENIDRLLSQTELNTVVIAIKEIQGEVYIPGVRVQHSTRTYVDAIPDIKSYLHYLKERGIYTIARIVVFKDSILAKDKPEWAVQTSTPSSLGMEKGFPPHVWVDYKGLAWADPYSPWVWKYNIDVAVRAVELGFQEIQFDYIRFPSDGDMASCVYSKPHSPDSAARILSVFLQRANERLRPLGAQISIDVFGLAGSYGTGLGIGQKLDRLLSHIDAVSPMMYPSHYAAGEYGIVNPNQAPYDIVFLSIRDTQKVIGERPVVLRPYLQDFSLGFKYSAQEVRDQIQAAHDLGVNEWLLWNAACNYTFDALQPKNQIMSDPR